MTEKRFVNKGKDIFQYGGWWCSASGEHCADVIATAMNELIEENEQLKQQNKRLEEKIQRERTSFTKTHERWSKEAEIKIKELSEENEELKQKVDFYKYFQKDARELEKDNEQLHKENKQIKDLIHIMLNQIDVENINSDSAIYSARINFSKNEFNLIRKLWNRS